MASLNNCNVFHCLFTQISLPYIYMEYSYHPDKIMKNCVSNKDTELVSWIAFKNF